jgi:D-sedoheptulose 7-phosphate isomerase
VDNLIKSIFNESIDVKKITLEKEFENIKKASNLVVETVKNNKKIMLCGNGGSAADSQHIATEFTVRLKAKHPRKAVNAIALTTDTSHLTACSNDFGFDFIFSRLVEAYGNKGDLLILFSTSGNSNNVIEALKEAKKMGIKTIGLLGSDGGKLKELCDISIVVPNFDSGRIQEVHILIGHIFCEMVDKEVFGY